MTALEKYRDQVRIARELGHCVVQTADEAQAVLDEIDGNAKPARLPTAAEVRGIFADAPPYESDDVHHD